jgi:hypothetical protein
MHTFSDKLIILVPYGNGYAQNHFAYGNGEGDVTLCGRNCYGWSIARDFAGSDMDSAYSCKRCIRGAST